MRIPGLNFVQQCWDWLGATVLYPKPVSEVLIKLFES